MVACMVCMVCDNEGMRKYNNDQPTENDRFKPPQFLVYYLQRLFIWGDWSLCRARYNYRRERTRYQRYQARQQSDPDQR